MRTMDAAISNTASNRRDPSRSSGLRRYGRMLVNRRVFELNKALRQTIQENDVVGLVQARETQPQFTSWVENNAQRLGRAEPMLQRLVETTLTHPPDWLTQTIMGAVERGVRQALRELSQPNQLLNPSDVGEFHATAAAVEVQGIGWETKRRILRHVGQALETKQRPAELMREVRTSLENVTRRRLILLVNTAVVRALNAGKLFAYRNNGVLRVGVEAEWLPKGLIRHRDHNHKWRDVALVNVLTAGDDNVCEDCEDIAGDGPYTLEEAAGLIPAHPNCRCAFVPEGDRRFAEIEERTERRREEEDED
jgi:hypothetical protein